MGRDQLFHLRHFLSQKYLILSGPINISAIHSVVPEDVKAGGEDHPEDNHDAEEDEGDGAKGDIIQVTSCKCP